MQDEAQIRHLSYLEMKNESDCFHKSYTEAVRTLSDKMRESYVSPKNYQRFFHGAAQISMHRGEPEEIEMHELAVEGRTAFQDLADGNLTIIIRSIHEITNELHTQFARGFYQLLSDTCAKTGNVVDAAKSQSTADAFMEMFEKIELVANSDEQVALPEIRLSSREQGERLMRAVTQQPPEYQARFEALKEKKIREAIERERLRKTRFVRYNK